MAAEPERLYMSARQYYLGHYEPFCGLCFAAFDRRRYTSAFAETRRFRRRMVLLYMRCERICFPNGRTVFK